MFLSISIRLRINTSPANTSHLVYILHKSYLMKSTKVCISSLLRQCPALYLSRRFGLWLTHARDAKLRFLCGSSKNLEPSKKIKNKISKVAVCPVSDLSNFLIFKKFYFSFHRLLIFKPHNMKYSIFINIIHLNFTRDTISLRNTIFECAVF